jgi:hypothetical protein
MKFRGRSSIGKDDLVVSTATAKKNWFLKDLRGLPNQKPGTDQQFMRKDLDRLALKVHGRDGLAKKREARSKRLENKTKKVKAGKKKKREEDVEQVAAPRKKRAVKVVEKEKTKRVAGKKKKREEEEEEDVDDEEDQVGSSRKKRSSKDDDDFVPEQNEGPKSKKQNVSSCGERSGGDELIAKMKQRNEMLDGTWAFQGCPDSDSDLVLKLSKNGKSLSGNCMMSGCDVRLKCTDLFREELNFHAIFKTQRAKFVGCTIRTTEKSKTLSVSYFNGARGMGAVSFSDVTAKKRR